MKKAICIVLLFILTGWMFIDEPLVKGDSVSGKTLEQSKDTIQDDDFIKSLSRKLIRFHVIANSDSVEDQALKLKVRDKVLNYMSPKLKKSNSIEESRKILMNEDKAIKDIASKVIKENGYSYSISTVLSMENFPIKSYGNITLPQGKYEAYKIIIESGKGQNWWCVMFPPLCFVDITKSEVSKKQTEEEMKKVLSDKEFDLVDNSNSLTENIEKKASTTEHNEIKIKFKLLEVIENFKNEINNVEKK